MAPSVAEIVPATIDSDTSVDDVTLFKKHTLDTSSVVSAELKKDVGSLISICVHGAFQLTSHRMDLCFRSIIHTLITPKSFLQLRFSVSTTSELYARRNELT
jgi:hypothetical protein